MTLITDRPSIAQEGETEQLEAGREERARRPRWGAKRRAAKRSAPEAPQEASPLHVPTGARARSNARKARRGGYSRRANPAPTTTAQAEILNPALIAAPTDDEGIAIGRDMLSKAPVAHDPFTAYTNGVVTSPAVIVLGVIGSGKSSLIKTCYVLRPLILRGRRAVVMDRKDQEGEGEYAELTRRLGNEPLKFRLGAGGTVINPLDPTISAALGRAGQFGLLRVIAERAAGMETLEPWQMRALRDAHAEVLRRHEDDRVPVLEDLTALLGRVHDRSGDMSTAARERLHQAGLQVRFMIEGLLEDELGGLFNGHTSEHVVLNGKLTTFDISQLPEDGPANALVQAVAHALVLGRLRTDRGHGTNFVSEEGWSLVSGPVARQMNANQRLARGLGLSNVVAMHHIADVPEGSEAFSMLREPQTIHIYRQDRQQDIDATVRMYGLDPGTAQALATLEQGHHLMKVGRRAEVQVRHVRSELETRLTSTDNAMQINQI